MEQEYADDVLSETNVEHDSLASQSSPLMDSACADNVSGDRNVGHYTLGSQSTPIREQVFADNVLRETNVQHDNLVSGDTQGKEVHPSEINHDHYRFAYDLVEKVLKFRRELNPSIDHNLPEPSTFIFTEEHEKIIDALAVANIIGWIRKADILASGVYDFQRYYMFKTSFVEKWKNKFLSEETFITFCALLAHVAAHFTQKNYYCGALDDAVVSIATWIGTTDRSSWQ